MLRQTSRFLTFSLLWCLFCVIYHGIWVLSRHKVRAHRKLLSELVERDGWSSFLVDKKEFWGSREFSLAIEKNVLIKCCQHILRLQIYFSDNLYNYCKTKTLQFSPNLFLHLQKHFLQCFITNFSGLGFHRSSFFIQLWLPQFMRNIVP